MNNEESFPQMQKAVEILKNGMSKEEFLAFQLEVDNDGSRAWWEFVTEAAVEIAPDNFCLGANGLPRRRKKFRK